MILLDAKKCRYCGEFLEGQKGRNGEPEKRRGIDGKGEGCFLQTMNVGCVVIVLVVVFIIVITWINDWY